MKGSGHAVYFYATDGRRYVFPNVETYTSWYPTFANISTVSNEDLGSISIGGNVTIKPGSKLVKVTTDPKVYAVASGRTLRWVKTETIARTLYGATWNTNVVDVPDTFFTNYLVGAPIESSDQFVPTSFDSLTLLGSEFYGPGSTSVTQPITTTPPIPAPPSTPPPATTSSVTVPPNATRTILAVKLTASQATLYQNVSIFAEVTGNIKPITRIEIKTETDGSILATCLNATTCSAIYTVTKAPLIEKFYAIAYNEDGQIFMPADQRPTLVVASASNDLQFSVVPQQITNGSRASFTSDYTFRGATVKSHKIYGLLSGSSQPYLWRDCGGTSSCAGSTVFYRTTDLFSQVVTDGTTVVSPIARVTALGAPVPVPVLKATKYGINIMNFQLTPPSGEMISETVIVDGTRMDDPPFAICQGPCSITLLIRKPGAVTAFTWVGGTQESSNTIIVTPE